ncbi:MAG TPA: type II secretion system protein [Candidatus Paceibacterota bacterium]|jgi:prepilin-type N-terminal cleavage/methylation domain-containing protein|nr:type II secretion system protein [Candidatus Paceibacterota bacterium]
MKKLIKKNRIRALQAGMTYIEIIVVLAIFSLLSGVVIYNYGGFQAKVDIKNLASDIALKVVEAQKSSLSGLLPEASVSSTWKPSYGVYFNLVTKGGPNHFTYFVDIDQDGELYDQNCSLHAECLDRITITRDNIISSLEAFYSDTEKSTSLEDLTITFSRPSSGAVIKSNTPFDPDISYVQINMVSPNGTAGVVKLYPSGRIQVY